MHAIMLITIYLKAILELPKTSSMNSQRNFASLNMLNIGSNILAKFHNFDSYFSCWYNFLFLVCLRQQMLLCIIKCFLGDRVYTDKIQIECYVKFWMYQEIHYLKYVSCRN